MEKCHFLLFKLCYDCLSVSNFPCQIPEQFTYGLFAYDVNPGEIKIGILTVSDRASAGVYEDLSGKAIISTLRDYISSDWSEVYDVIPDEQDLIEKALKDIVDVQGCCLVVTTGGTGPAIRDVTPEATEAVSDKMMPGFGEFDAPSEFAICANGYVIKARSRDQRQSIDY